MKEYKPAFIALFILGFLALAAGRSFFVEVPVAAAQGAQPTATPQPVSPHSNTGDCLGCHSDPEMTGRFPDGSTMSLYFDPEAHPKSSHMPRCRACHEAQKTYPHQNSQQTACSVCHWQVTGVTPPKTKVFEVAYQDERAISLEISDSCKKCHAEKFTETADSVHIRMLEQGNRFAPVCVDCHSAHDIVQNSLTRESIPIICSTCHLSVYTSYKSSVHGAALGSAGEQPNTDLPTCGDCHGIHSVHGPREADFRANSIEVCGNCHSDAKKMAPYGLSTNVLQTYLYDFHGRTVDSDRMSNIPQTTKATCYDCHGVHNIRPSTDEASTVFSTNVQATCQQCHPDAGSNFPQAWLGHGQPDWNQGPALNSLNTFYQGFVPFLIGGSLLYMGLDAVRRIRTRFSRRPHDHPAKGSEPNEQE
jgi:predicted CXXCH cytochrome family protein